MNWFLLLNEKAHIHEQSQKEDQKSRLVLRPRHRWKTVHEVVLGISQKHPIGVGCISLALTSTPVWELED